MHNFNKRQLSFLRLLTEQDVYCPISYFCSLLKVSDKTLKSDLTVIRSYLHPYNISISGKTGKGILIDACAKTHPAVLSTLKLTRVDTTRGSSTARRMGILKDLLKNSGINTSLQRLSSEYCVSRTSIVSDMKYIENWLAPFNISLQKAVNGTKINGDERDIRRAIASFLDGYTESGQIGGGYGSGIDTTTKLDIHTLIRLLVLFNIDDILYTEALLERVERENNIQIADMYYVTLLTHILICIKRVSDGLSIDKQKRNMPFVSANNDTQFSCALMIAQSINSKYNIEIGYGETYYIYQYLLSSQTDKQGELYKNQAASDNTPEIVKAFIAHLSDILQKDFLKESNLFNELLAHIRPLLSRLRNNICISNPLAGEIKSSYPELFGICRIIFQRLAQDFNLQPINDDEIADVAAYVQAQLMKINARKNVVVVCHSGYGTSLLLETKLKQTFPDFNIVATVSSRKLDSMNLSGVDIIISTVAVNVPDVPHITVSAILSERDVQSIRTAILSSAALSN